MIRQTLDYRPGGNRAGRNRSAANDRRTMLNLRWGEWQKAVRLLAIALLILITRAAPVTGQEASPTVVPVSASECEVDPLSFDAIMTLTRQGLAARASERWPVTEAALASPTLSLTGEPADPAAVAAIGAAAREYEARVNAGNLPAELALMTADTASRVLADLVRYAPGAGDLPRPTESLDDVTIEQILLRLLEPAPVPLSFQRAFIEVREARLGNSGCVRATVVTMTERSAPERVESLVDYCLVDGQYRRHVGPPPSGVVSPADAATPAP